MKNKLSIIVPCYNCEATLQEAVNSCYQQGFSNDEFEIIMVDDGSTDGTRSLMENLASEHTNIRLVFHPKNRGGGAARNTGIKEANGEIIYCLDSDNFFVPNSVKQMLKHFKIEKTDGVAFHERRYFSGSDYKNFTPVRVPLFDKHICLEDFFASDHAFVDNFFYTKSSYEKTDGYPEHHGYDTQSFELRYTAAGNSISICPESSFYHRQIVSGTSYFEREYNKGNVSINYYLCLEDIIEIFSEDTLLEIINYDIFTHATLTDNIYNFLIERNREKSIFGTLTKIDSLGYNFKQAVQSLHNHKYQDAIFFINECLKYTLPTKVLTFITIRAQFGLAGTNAKQASTQTLHLLAGLTPRTQRLYHPLLRNKYLSRIVQTKSYKYMTNLKTDFKRNIYMLTKKLRSAIRHAKSLYISSSIVKDDKTAYLKLHKELIDMYKKENKTYNYAEFLMPAWEKFRLHIENRFVNEPGFAFLRDPVIKSTMFFAHTPKGQVHQLNLIEKIFGKKITKDLLIENSTGKPILSNRTYNTSGNSIHQLYHLARFENDTGKKVTEFETVLEYGGGYGCLAKICKRINPNATYIIIDIPIFSYIQALYLKIVLDSGVVKICNKNEEITKHKVNIVPLDSENIRNVVKKFGNIDLFISTWALSESNETTHRLLNELNYFNSKNLLIAYQRNNQNFPFATNIKDIGNSYNKIFNAEIEYQPGNYYLFADKK